MFERFPSLSRFSQGWTVTEKIDGTNAQVFIIPCTGDFENYKSEALAEKEGLYLFAGSRSRRITLDNDNMGFARWAQQNAEMLLTTLGEGRHFGEWWGQGIQRNYGLKEKRFSLFNALRWKQEELPEDLHVVPCLLRDTYIDNASSTFNSLLEELHKNGSYAAPGFDNPEGIVMYHRQSGVSFKKTFDYDEYGKWKENQERKVA